VRDFTAAARLFVPPLDNRDWTYAIVTEAAAAGHAGFAGHWRTIAPAADRARRWCERSQRALRRAAG
jgi:hypothetical protein